MARQPQHQPSKILLPLAGAGDKSAAPLSQAVVLQCSTCQHWHANDDKKYGQCRRYPPSGGDVIPGQGTPAPITASDYWCGEWKSKTA